MLTPEQEQFLADFADKGLAEQAEVQARNAQVELETELIPLREAKKAELEAQAQDLITKGLEEFEATAAHTVEGKALEIWAIN